jgi:hypothetical protein
MDYKGIEAGGEGIGLTAFFAAGHDGGVEALTEAGGEIVDLMGAVDLDGLAGGRERDFAVVAVFEMGLQFAARLHGDFVVDQVVKQSEKFCAGHFSTPFFRRK